MRSQAFPRSSQPNLRGSRLRCAIAAVAAVALLSLARGALGAITVTAPASTVNVAEGADYATQVLQDPWDMNQRTDLGWFLFSADSPPSSLTSLSFSGGIFSATTTSTDPLFFLLDSAIPGTANLGKTGAKYPIDASKYTVLAFRMSVNTGSAAQVFWSPTDMYTGVTGAGNITVGPGWRISVQSLPALGIFYGSNPWSGQIRMLRLDPTVVSGDALQLDWVRLVKDDVTLYQNITWTGSSSVDIYLDNDNVAGNGNLGLVKAGVSGSSYNFFVGALPAGDYWVAITAAGANPSTASYSAGHFHVDGTPTLAFTAPGEEGSSDDFATTQLGDPWDMNALTDIDSYAGITSLVTTSITAENEAGVSLGFVGVADGISALAPPASVGDPRVWLLFGSGRGATHHIDPDRYRVLTLELGMPVARDLVNGSIARVIWRVAGETLENVSDDISVDSKSGSPVVIDRIITDMKTLPLESDAGGSPSTTGWNKGSSGNPGIESFRIDPHEFSNPTEFYIKRVKLAAFERASASYQIGWQYNSSGSATTLSLYYDLTGLGFAGTLIASGLNPTNVDASNGSYTWNTSSLAPGTYYIYTTIVRGGSVISQTYARWPIVKDAIPAPSVSGVSPGTGPIVGGTSVTITGIDFQTGATVTFGGVAATGVTVGGATSITATTPAHAAGAVDVVVTNPDAQSGTLTVGFTYLSGSATISLNHTVLYFGATTGGTTVTSGQEITVTIAGGALGWTATPNGSFIQVSPASGSGSGKFTVSIVGGSYPTPGISNGSVTVAAPGAANSPQTIQVTLKVYAAGTTASPLGYIDSPADGVTGIVGAVPFTGWALDDIEVTKVELWRDPFGAEPPTHPNGLVYIGVATLVSGQRPDVEATYPSYPMAYRGAWGYSILTNLLPSGGNGTYRLHAYVFDAEGHRTYLGSRRFTASNATATKPFGTIDTPAQGATISGSAYVSWGWALTPLPSTIPADGSSIWVYIDGVQVGHPSVGYPRSDIDSLFPGLNNSGAGVRYYMIDTTTLSNGVHTIVWGVVDNNGNAEGLGSRYFWVLN